MGFIPHGYVSVLEALMDWRFHSGKKSRQLGHNKWVAFDVLFYMATQHSWYCLILLIEVQICRALNFSSCVGHGSNGECRVEHSRLFKVQGLSQHDTTLKHHLSKDWCGFQPNWVPNYQHDHLCRIKMIRTQVLISTLLKFSTTKCPQFGSLNLNTGQTNMTNKVSHEGLDPSNQDLPAILTDSSDTFYSHIFKGPLA